MKILAKLTALVLIFSFVLIPLGTCANENTYNDLNGIKVAYIPIDNRPVNFERAIYLAESVGIELLMPEEDLFRTALDNMEPNQNGTTYGDRTALMNWLKSVDDECDYFVLSLDQMLSGGLVSSRWLSNTDLTLEYEIADYIINLSKNNHVVLFDTVMRLASTVNYQDYQIDKYNLLRSYGSVARATLSGDDLTVDNIIAGYRYGTDGEVITTELPDEAIDKYLASRQRKLRLIDYILDNALRDIEYCYIGVDDSSPDTSVQTNEINYIRTKTADKSMCFAGTDELGLMGLTKVVTMLYGTADVDVTYYGGGEHLIADSLDFETLENEIEFHITSIGCNITESTDALQVLVLTRRNQELVVPGLIDQARYNLNNNIPTVIIDPTFGSAGNLLQRALIDADLPLTMLLGYSSWNTAANAMGIALSTGISRYLYLKNSPVVTIKSHEGYLKSISFSLLKDISYKNLGISIGWTEANTLYGYRHILSQINGSYMITDLSPFISSKHRTVVCENFRYPWDRAFEMTFDISLTDDDPLYFDPDDPFPPVKSDYFNLYNYARKKQSKVTVEWFPSEGMTGCEYKVILLAGEPDPTNSDEAALPGTVILDQKEKAEPLTELVIDTTDIEPGKWIKIGLHCIGTDDGWKVLYFQVIEADDIMLGDINGDREITSTDYLLCKRIQLGTYPAGEDQKKAADVNRDGKISAADYLILKRHVIGTYTIVQTH